MSARFGRSRRSADVPPRSELDDLISDMRDLRLTLAADLTAAAGAAEAGADEVAADIVAGDRAEVARFAREADQRLLRLQRLAVAPPDAPRWRRRVAVALPAVPVVGALAVSAAAVTGALPLPGGSASPRHEAIVQQAAPNRLTTSFRHFATVLDNHPNASQVIAAAHRLHRELAAMIAASPRTPGGAAEVARLLQLEQSLLLHTRPPGAAVVLDATRKLAARLVRTAPGLTSPAPLPTGLPSLPVSPRPDGARHHHAHHPAAATPTASPDPDATPSPSGHDSPSPQPTSFPVIHP